jgi:hypothetical protein
MSDRAIIIAALIIGGAIVAGSLRGHARFALSAADNNVAWRMDTWSGEVDLCAAAPLPNGPLVRCGALVVVPQTGAPSAPANSAPSPAAPLSPLDSPENRSL